MEYLLADFLEIIVAELEQYEEVDTELVDAWCEKFENIVENEKLAKGRKITKNGEVYIKVKDEMEIFSIVDDYIEAIEDNTLKAYWNSFS